MTRLRRAVLHPVTGAGVATVVLLGIWLLVWSGVFAVGRLAVSGLPAHPAADEAPVTAAQVRAAADVARGTALATVNLAAVAGRVKALPGVASARVSRHWPATLAIAVTLRRGVAELVGDGAPRLLDAGGDPFAPVPAGTAGLVAVTVSGPVPGAGEAGLHAAMGVLASLPAGVRAQLQQIRADGPESVTLQLTGHRAVQWGSATDAHRKAVILAALLVAPSTRGAHTFDVSAPDVVAVR